MALRTERLRKMREKQGFSQRELARLCGLGEVMVHRYESGTTDPSTKYLTVIAEKLAVSTDYLVGLSDSPNGPVDNSELDADERAIVQAFRSDGWTGIVRLGAERIPQ